MIDIDLCDVVYMVEIVIYWGWYVVVQKVMMQFVVMGELFIVYDFRELLGDVKLYYLNMIGSFFWYVCKDGFIKFIG